MSWRYFIVRENGAWSVWQQYEGESARVISTGHASMDAAVDHIASLNPGKMVGFPTGYIGPAGHGWFI